MATRFKVEGFTKSDLSDRVFIAGLRPAYGLVPALKCLKDASTCRHNRMTGSAREYIARARGWLHERRERGIRLPA
jgi:hypothetical protein